MTEAKLQAAILDALEACGVLAWKNTSGRRGHTRMGLHSKRHPVGSSDIIACYNGRFYAFEVKLPGEEGKGSRARLAAQKKFRDDVASRGGGVARVVTSVAEAIEAMDKFYRR